MMKDNSILVVGGGVTGLCSAYYLAKTGWKVTLVDKYAMEDNCSYGNAGMIVPSHFIPLAAPGVITKGVRWLFNKKSPFYIKPSLNPSVIKWGKNFIAHAHAQHVSESAPFIRDLNLFSKAEYSNLKEVEGFDFSLHKTGILMLYKHKKTEEEEQETALMAKEMGLACEVLSPEEIKVLEPDVELDIIGGVHYRSDAFLSPPEFMRQMINRVTALGVDIHHHCEIDRVEIRQNRIDRIFAGEKEFLMDKYVFCTGADLGKTAQSAQIKIPMMPGKGYSFMTGKFENKLRCAALLIDDKVSITPMGNEVRIGGTMELGNKNHHIKWNKIKGITEAVSKYYPGIDIKLPEEKEIWHGFRPCSPDGLPYLGESKKINNLIIAGGAGMMGMSCGPGIGKLVSELAAGEKTSVSIEKFNPERFTN